MHVHVHMSILVKKMTTAVIVTLCVALLFTLSLTLSLDEHVSGDPLVSGCGSERRLAVLEALLDAPHIRPHIITLVGLLTQLSQLCQANN